MRRYNIEDYDEDTLNGCLTGMMRIALIVVALVWLCSCKSVQYVEVPVVKIDTVYQSKTQHDSIWMHDSIYVHEYIKGDTVFMERIKWHTKYIEKLRTDTMIETKIDSVAVPYPVEVKVEKQLNWWQRLRLWLGNIVLIGGLIAAGWWVWKRTH